MVLKSQKVSLQYLEYIIADQAPDPNEEYNEDCVVVVRLVLDVHGNY